MGKSVNEKLGHADEADGIEEYDNALPDWWLGLFGVTIVFAAVYPIWFHGFGNTQIEAYEREMAAAAERWPQSDVTDVKELPSDPETLAAGKEIFEQTCAACHNKDLTGGIGPSLVDDEWLHGSSGPEILATIMNGVPSKGMPAWGPQIGATRVQQVAAYVYSKKGSGGGAGAPAQAQAATADAGSEGPPDPEKLFQENCAACHKADMTGQIGPNLIDDEWIHGGELEQIKHTITHGVPEKGMTAWGPILGEEKIEALARYVHDKGKKK